jgi:cold shock CspA family protein
MLNGPFPANLFVHISAVERAGLSTLNEGSKAS